MKSRMDSLDMLANNIANSATAGFKSDREFHTLYEGELPEIERQWTDFSQGTLTPTGNSLDVALSGKGFFALNSPGGTVYSRNGSFRLSKANELETAEGYTVRNAADKGRPIKVDPAQTIDIAKDGVVRQGGQEIGKIEIASTKSPALDLTKLGNSYYSLSGTAAPAGDTEVQQGKLEQSNVPVAETAVRLITVMRQFEMLQKAVTLDSEMSKRAIDDVARVA
jgi:flagellar basal-body rod protein FlgF